MSGGESAEAAGDGSSWFQTAWITPAVDTIPLQLGYYLAILLSCLVGVALLMSVKPLCWLFTGQSFSSACRECNLFALFRRNPSKQTPAS